MARIEKISRKHKALRLVFNDHRAIPRRIHVSEDRRVCQRLLVRIEELVRCRATGESPPAWATQLPEAIAEKLAEWDVLPARRLAWRQGVEPLAAEWEASLLAGGCTPRYAAERRRYVERMAEALEVRTPSDFAPEPLLAELAAWREAGRSDNTVNQALSAMRGFTRWLRRSGRAPEDHLADMRSKVTTRRERPRDRRPFTPDEFRRLLRHLDTLEAQGGRYRWQNADWTALDRKMVYWTAVATGLRQGELSRLRVGDVDLSREPAVVSLDSRWTKNGLGAEVPIPAELASALKTYLAGRGAGEAAFLVPESRTNVIKMFKRDLAEAGVERKTEAGGLDFHSLRHTAITWWLVEHQMHPREVQYYARLSSLALVDRYSRGLRLRSLSWVERGPRLSEGESEGETGRNQGNVRESEKASSSGHSGRVKGKRRILRHSAV